MQPRAPSTRQRLPHLPCSTALDTMDDQILAVLQQARDRSTDSVELMAHAADERTRHHLGPDRTYVLRPFLVSHTVRVLDAGAGTGVVARYIGEQGATVVAVEPVPIRARAARIRCADLPNVEVVNAQLDTCEALGAFDLVIAGDLATGGVRPHESSAARLAQLARLVAPGGAMLLAVDNPFGLPHVLAPADRHEPPCGLIDRLARTPGRRRLGQRLREAGLGAQRWLYAYPAHTRATAILDAAAFGRADALQFVDAFVRWPIDRHDGEAAPRGDDRLAHRALLAEGLGPDVAGAFVVLAARTATDLSRFLDRGFLALRLTSARSPRWRTWKRFESVGDAIVVTGGPATPTHEDWLVRVPVTSSRFVEGPTLEQLALDACGHGTGALGAVLREWRRHLGGIETSPPPAARRPFGRCFRAALPGRFLDVVLSNFVSGADGRLHYVDDEWRVEGAVDADLVYGRALFWFATDLVTRHVRHPFGASASVGEIADHLADLCGVPPPSHLPFIGDEAAFQAKVCDDTESNWRARIESTARMAQLDDPRRE